MGGNMPLRSNRLAPNLSWLVGLALTSVVASGCSDESPERSDAGGSGGGGRAQGGEQEDPEVDLALASLTVSVGALAPAFDPAVEGYAVSFEGSVAAQLVAVPRNPDATVTIAGVAGEERRLRTPLGTTVAEVVVSLGNASRTYRVSLDRAGDYVADPPLSPPDEPPMNEDDLNLKGYGYPTVSPDGRFIAVQLGAPTVDALHRYIDIFRADGPEITFEKRLDNADLPVAFCDAGPGCLWTYRGPFDQTPGRWQFTHWGDGAWTDLGPAWEWSNLDIQYLLLDVDAPHTAIAFDATSDAGMVPLGSDGSFGAIEPIPGLGWGDQYGGHVVSKDRQVFIHTSWDLDGRGPGLRVFAPSSAGWTLVETIPPVRDSPYYGSSMRLSADGRELYVGDSWAEVNGLLEAGAVDHYTRGPEGFELVQTFLEPVPRAYAGFGGFLRGDAATGDIHVGAVEPGEIVPLRTLVYSLLELDEAIRLEHPGGVLQAPRDVSFFAGVALDARQHGVLHVYR